MAISLTIALFSSLLASGGALDGCTHLFWWGGFHVKTFVYYDKYFGLADEERGTVDALPSEFGVEFRDVRFKYPGTDKEILQGLTFSIKLGVWFALVSENGVGKTTFVKLVTGMITQSYGEAHTIPGNNLSAVMQDPSRYNTFTVGDNVFFGDVERRRSESEIDASMTFSGFEGADKDALLGKDVGGTDLSGGQRQKLAIARAAYRNRDLIILDKPTGNLVSYYPCSPT
jgi:ATP-binding cassette subfamily B protein